MCESFMVQNRWLLVWLQPALRAFRIILYINPIHTFVDHPFRVMLRIAICMVCYECAIHALLQMSKTYNMLQILKTYVTNSNLL